MALRGARLAVVFVVAAIVGTALDRIHTFFGVLHYPRPCFCEESCWVPAIMGGAGVALVGTHALFRSMFRQAPGGGLTPIVVAGAIFVAAYFASGLLQAHPLLLLAGYALVAVVQGVSDPRPARLATVVTAMVLGIVAEYVLTQVGFFEYTHPDVAGLPYWIGGLYWFAGYTGDAVENRWPVLTGP